MTKPNFLKCDCRHCGGHIEFPAEAAGQTGPCPHCGQPTVLAAPVAEPETSPARRSVWGIAGPLLAVAAIAGAYFFLYKSNHGPAPAPAIISATTNQPAARPLDEIVTNEFSVSAIKLEKTPGTSLVYVTGKLQNLSDKERYGVKLVLALFDTNDVSAGTAKDFRQSIEPHGDWDFKALVLDSKAASARFSSVSEDR